MRGSVKDIPAAVETPEMQIRTAEWGGMAVELGKFKATVDPSPLFKGLPDDRCQSPHWGYVIKGTLRYKFAGREEVFKAGDAYYVAPGHTPIIEAGTEYVELSPADLIRKTMEVVERNMAAMSST
jgi:hypothetical protein